MVTNHFQNLRPSLNTNRKIREERRDYEKQKEKQERLKERGF
jgi:hypothetical protein